MQEIEQNSVRTAYFSECPPSPTKMPHFNMKAVLPHPEPAPSYHQAHQMLVLMLLGFFTFLWSSAFHGDFSCVRSKVSRTRFPSGPKVWTPACSAERRWPGFPQQPAAVRCPDCPQGRSAPIPQAPFESSLKKPRAAQTRCSAGSRTTKSNSLLPEGRQKLLLLLLAAS